jgi:hypothetical protein
MRRVILTVALSVLALGQAEVASAQLGVSLEGRIAATTPVGDLSRAGVEGGLGLGAEALLSVQNNLSAYVSVSQHRFACPRSQCMFNGDLRSTGFGVGLKYILPSTRSALVWGRAGLISHHLSTPTASGPRDLGFELGMGVDLDVSRRLAFVPHVSLVNHYGTPGRTVPPPMRTDEFASRYMTIGLAAHLHLH